MALSANNQKGVQILNSLGQPYNVSAKMLFEDINVDPETGDVTIVLKCLILTKITTGCTFASNIERASVPQALLVPEQAIQRNMNGDPQVYVVNAKGIEVRP